MNKKGKFAIFLTLAALLLAGALYAGSLNQANGPNDAGTAMYTLEDIYNRLLNGTPGTKRTTPFAEPGAAPASTGHTLDDIYNLIRAFVPETGQTDCYYDDGTTGTCTCGTANCASGQDGDFERGFPWPSPRFKDNLDGTVTDNLTGLIWLKNANCWGSIDWKTALTNCNNLASGACGLSDGSVAGQWRLPNIKELQSLIDFGHSDPALPAGHPFTGVQSQSYFTSTSYADSSTPYAWYVSLYDGNVDCHNKPLPYSVWPVRGGH